jgi:GDP-D-mannose 3', 5'-epimerase
MNASVGGKNRMKQRKALVLGAGGFIGNHMVRRLKSEGFFVRGVDLKVNEFEASRADEYVLGDLRRANVVADAFDGDFDEVYQFAADMGGAGYIFTGSHDADIMHNSALINLNVLEAMLRGRNVGSIFYSSSACIYPGFNQTDPSNPVCSEESAYPANPDSEYGWEKLFSERLYTAFARQHGLTVRIARYHNIFGPLGTYDGGREKVPAALCRKIASTADGGEIEVWGPGNQTRSFLFIDECIEGTVRLMRSNVDVPVNIGSEEVISINDLARMLTEISGKSIGVKNTPGPIGVMGRNSDNKMLRARLGWEPQLPLRAGLEKTYRWIERQLTRC